MTTTPWLATVTLADHTRRRCRYAGRAEAEAFVEEIRLVDEVLAYSVVRVDASEDLASVLAWADDRGQGAVEPARTDP